MRKIWSIPFLILLLWGGVAAAGFAQAAPLPLDGTAISWQIAPRGSDTDWLYFSLDTFSRVTVESLGEYYFTLRISNGNYAVTRTYWPNGSGNAGRLRRLAFQPNPAALSLLRISSPPLRPFRRRGGHRSCPAMIPNSSFQRKMRSTDCSTRSSLMRPS